MYKIIKIIFLTICFYLVINKSGLLNNEIYFRNIQFMLTVVFGFLLYFIFENKTKLAVGSYLIGVFIVMTFRKEIDKNINIEFYLIDWLEKMFSNRIILINIVCNGLLFVPLIILLLFDNKKYFLNIVICIIVIILLETIQFISKRGIFDIVDIVLNMLGVLIGALGYRTYEVVIWKKTKNKIINEN